MDNILTQDDLQKLSRGELHSLAVRGILKVLNTTTLSIPLPRTMTKEDLPEYRRYANLSGVSIGIGEAARKYNIPTPTISRWVKRGLIARLGRGKNRMILIDEADVAYCASIARARPGSGRWLFNPDGTPYIPS